MDPSTSWSEAITIPATPDGIARLDAWLADRCRGRGLPASVSDAVRLCAAELAANVKEHGFSGGGGSVTVRLSHDDVLEMEMADPGRPFDPTAVADPPMPASIETAPESGYGLRLVRGFAHRFAYRREEGLNVVSLSFDPSSGQ